MSARGLQTLIATTLTDRRRRELLLDRHPAAYDGFDLSVRELTDLLAIQAQTLEEFAAQAHSLFYREDVVAPDSALDPVALTLLPELGCA